MNLLFSIGEGFRGLARIKGSAILAILILSMAISMVGVAGIVGWNGAKFVQYLRSQFDLTVFIGLETPEADIGSLGASIQEIQGVESIYYVSPNQAADQFEQEFGEKVIDILGSNPFPSTYIVKLSPQYGNAVDAAYIAKNIASLKGVEEVKFRKALLVTIDRYIKILSGIGGLVGLIVILAALFISSYTIKLTIFAKRNLIWTMRLVGATDGFVRRPFIVEGVIEGLVAATIATGIVKIGLFAATRLMRGYIPLDKLEVPQDIYIGMLLFGIILGWFSSIVSVRRYLKEML